MPKRNVNNQTGKVELRRREMSEFLAKLSEDERRREEKAKAPMNKDTEIRKNIHNDIKMMLAEGRKRIDILIELSNRYTDTNLSKFFEQWVEHHIEKKDYLQVLDKESR